MWQDDLGAPAAKRQRLCTASDVLWELINVQASVKDQDAAKGNDNRLLSCPVCLEDVPRKDAIRLDGCRHAFCRDCLTAHFSHAVRGRILPLSCPLPRCTAVVAGKAVKTILAGQDASFLDKLDMASLIPEHLQFYCPYPDCTALMEVEAEEQLPGCPSQCPACQRAVCSACRSAWHDGMTCARHQALRRPRQTAASTAGPLQQQQQQQQPLSRQASLSTAFCRAVSVFAGPAQNPSWQQGAAGTSGFNVGQWQGLRQGDAKDRQSGQQQGQQQWQGAAWGGGRAQQFGQQGQQLQGSWPGSTPDIGPAAVEMRQGGTGQPVFAWGM